MMRATLTYAVLLATALTFSWLEWTSEEEIDLEGRVVVLNGDLDAISAVRWSGEETEATITRRSDDRGDYLWVEYTRWTERKVTSSADDAGAADEPETERIAKNSVFKSAAGRGPPGQDEPAGCAAQPRSLGRCKARRPRTQEPGFAHRD